MKKFKLSLITTVFNEQKTIIRFLQSVFKQSRLPDEIIIVDGGSTDNTLSRVSKFKFPKNKYVPQVKVLFKKGNRSIGRNEAIKNSKGEIILCSDAGCILDKEWVKNIIKPFEDKSVDVVAGYYKGSYKSIFQKCLVPYVLVMKDRVSPNEFLPATRSMAFKKSVWKKIGGFNEKLSHNEDYIFANKLKSSKAKIVFVKNAIVNWIPRKSLKQSFTMFLRFAFGDSESGILRDKVLLIFARYAFYLYLIILLLLIKSFILLVFIIISSIIYVLWSISKNYKYVNNPRAFVILPILQLTSDLAVLAGTSLGLIKFFLKIDYKTMFKSNLALIILLVIYIITMLSVITSGIPNQAHPFPYQMDEWHQLQAVRNVFKYGSPNLTGSANGTIFNFFLTGLLLIPFYLSRIINPFAIKSSVDSIVDQQKLFIVLRLITVCFGVLTAIFLSKISKLLKLNQFLIVSLFIFTPVWLVLSNFFKYDIALTFWIVLSLYYFIKYSFSPDLRNFLFACFFSAVAFATKVSGLPLLLILVLAYILFTPTSNKKFYYLFLGLLVYLFTSVFFGFPDMVFGGRNMNDYLFSNVISGPSAMLKNHNLDYSPLNLTLLHKLPGIFGHVLYFFSILAFIIVLISAILDFLNKNYTHFKLKIFLILSLFLFSISLIPLGITISANRAMVLLPFIVILDGFAFKEIIYLFKKRIILKLISTLLIILLLFVQIFESYIWILLKLSNLPEQSSSNWIIKNISNYSSIGLENIPIYQFEPDFILKEFYDKQYHANTKTKYNYLILDKNTENLPEYIVISNVEFERKFLKTSSKNDLVSRIEREGYKQIAYFPLSVSLYKYFDNYFYYPNLGLFTYPDGISVYKKGAYGN